MRWAFIRLSKLFPKKLLLRFVMGVISHSNWLVTMPTYILYSGLDLTPGEITDTVMILRKWAEWELRQKLRIETFSANSTPLCLLCAVINFECKDRHVHKKYHWREVESLSDERLFWLPSFPERLFESLTKIGRRRSTTSEKNTLGRLSEFSSIMDWDAFWFSRAFSSRSIGTDSLTATTTSSCPSTPTCHSTGFSITFKCFSSVGLRSQSSTGTWRSNSCSWTTRAGRFIRWFSRSKKYSRSQRQANRKTNKFEKQSKEVTKSWTL